MNRLFDFMKKFHAPGISGSTVVLAVMLFVFVGAVDVKADTFVVDSTLDAVDDNPGDTICDDGSGKCTLRAAVMESNALAGEDEISLSDETYVLTIPGVDNFAADGDLDIRDDLIIHGTGAKSTIIDAGGTTRVFHLIDGDDMNQITVQIFDLTMRNSLAGNAGGALRNPSEAVLLEGVSVESNSAPRGGGVYNGQLGDMQILNSVLHHNLATNDPGEERGGGLYNSGTLLLLNVTISNNLAGDLGGGIFNDSQMSALFVTIADNISTISGGLHQAVGADSEFYGSIIADNIGGDCGGVLLNSIGENISTSDCNLNDATDMPDTSPLISALQDNGGETLTHALLDGSPAIDNADDEFACALAGIDQRGVIRPVDGDEDGSAVCDTGAFETQPGIDSGEGGEGCSLAESGSSSKSLPLYFLIPACILIMRLIRRRQSLS